MMLSRTLRRLSMPSLGVRTATAVRTVTNVSNDGGEFARIDPSIRHTAPEQHEIPITATAYPTLPSFSLAGKTAIITGGARGLGYTMSTALLSSGCSLALLDLPSPHLHTATTALTALSRRLHPHSPPLVTAHETDVSDETRVKESFAEVLKAHGKVDVLVTSAGFCENIPAERYPADRLRALWSVNVDGTYFIAAEMARWVESRKDEGRTASMVFIGSMSGSVVNVPQPQAPYNASKAAVRSMAASMAVEWARLGIRVNCISPGYMVTPLTEKILDERPELREKWTSLTPAGRLGKPEDLSGAVVFLASEASGYITGADLRVDGGYSVV